MNKLLQLLRADAARYADRGGWAGNLGFWVGATHRLSEWARQQPRGVRRYATLVPAMGLTKLWRATAGACILEGADFGPGLCIPRARSLMIGRVRAGENCLIADHVTIGTDANACEFATLGRDVTVGAGARILGPVRVGDGARIGANTVVARSVPAGAKVVAASPRALSGGHAPRKGEG
jgi:serine O-acetyltransferase